MKILLLHLFRNIVNLLQSIYKSPDQDLIELLDFHKYLYHQIKLKQTLLLYAVGGSKKT